MENKVLVILGMHRSGTSLTAKWMHQCGINMGDNLPEPTFDNINGYYEDMDFVNLHMEILRSNGLSYTGLKGDVTELKLTKYHQKKMHYNLELKNSLRLQWGWKDPRTCLFLDQYHNFLPDAHYLITYRNPEQVVDSLLRRDYKKYSLGFKEQGVKGKIKEHVKKWYLKDVVQDSSQVYLKKWIEYNQLIVDFLNKIPEKNWLGFNISHVHEVEQEVYKALKKWGFEITKVDINSIFESELLTTRTELFKKDIKELSKTAADLTDKFLDILKK